MLPSLSNALKLFYDFINSMSFKHIFPLAKSMDQDHVKAKLSRSRGQSIQYNMKIV